MYFNHLCIWYKERNGTKKKTKSRKYVIQLTIMIFIDLFKLKFFQSKWFKNKLNKKTLRWYF